VFEAQQIQQRLATTAEQVSAGIATTRHGGFEGVTDEAIAKRVASGK
jgi:hypothetical protein